jgi:hypothetical protein
MEQLKELTVFSFGAGQESTTILHRLATDKEFYQRHVSGKLIVVGSDTGDEHDYTYSHIEWVKTFCNDHAIEFYWVTSDWGLHPKTWQSLTYQYKRNSSVGSAAFIQTCTDNLKVKVVDNFVEKWLKIYLKQPDKNRKSIYSVGPKIRLIIGYAKGEEKRTKNGNKHDAVWKKAVVERHYPLIVEGMDRQACIDHNAANISHQVWPSNCMRCFYQSDHEVLWLYRNHPDKFAEWVEMEKAKLQKWETGTSKNLGVYGSITLEQKLQKAMVLYGEWSDEQLNEYKFSHGHCIKSTY